MICLVSMLPWRSLRFSPLAWSATLHTGKDLAVSPSVSLRRLIPEGSPLLSVGTSLLAPRKSLWMGVTHYRAAPKCVCPDFPLSTTDEGSRSHYLQSFGGSYHDIYILTYPTTEQAFCHCFYVGPVVYP